LDNEDLRDNLSLIIKKTPKGIVMKRGRRPTTRPATWWDYRRVVGLVQMIHRLPPEKLDEYLRSDCSYYGLDDSGDTLTLIKRLSEFTLEHARNEWKGS
jgi:hypothetical protein